jgi:creatinine amidohydrolase
MAYHLAELFPAELRERLRRNPLVIQPIGTIEWHGHHLPLGFDGIVASLITEGIADAADAVLAPATYFAVGGVPYPFTFQLDGALLEPLYASVFAQYAAMGFRVALAFTGHFGLDQTLTLKRAAVTAMASSEMTVLPVTTYDLVADLYHGDHAAAGETSLLLAISPERVRLDAVPGAAPLEGIIGDDPRFHATKAYGARLQHLMIARAAETLARHLQADVQTRAEYVEALTAGVKVLEKTQEERRRRPKAEVPPITTPAYLEHCTALWGGRYQEAKRKAERKLRDLGQ